MTQSPAEFVDDPRFSKIFELQPNPATGRAKPFKLQYADYGYRNEAHPERENVLLFFAGLMGSRLVQITKDEIAKKNRVRIIAPDRPGVGGTDAVDGEHSMDLWREVIVALLGHLGIQHVSLGCHSAGTVWALDLLLHNPEILCPERPYLAIGGPWVLPSHTGTMTLSIVQALPSRVIAQSDKLARLIHNHVGPSIGASIGSSAALVAKLAQASTAAPSEDTRDGVGWEGVRTEEDLRPQVFDRLYAEGVQGISTDSLLVMQKVEGKDGRGWGDWGDYDVLVPRLAEALRGRTRRLAVDVLYAEKDWLIGDGGESKGAKWFDQCWDPAKFGDVIEFRRRMVKGADHDGIWNLRWGAAQEVYGRIGHADGPTTPDPCVEN